MCRSIRTLRPPYAEAVTDADVHAAALQYVRKISGFRAPSRRNAAAFDLAVEAVAAATRELLSGLHPTNARPAARSEARSDEPAEPADRFGPPPRDPASTAADPILGSS